MSNIWGFDIAFGINIRSHLQDMKDHGLKFAIFRVGQGLYHAIDNIVPQVAAADEFGIPYGLYMAIHPWYSATKQVDRFLANFQGANPSSIFLDFELHGSEDPLTRSAVYQQAFNYCKERIPTIPVVGNYSGAWFINAWAPAMTTWIGQAPYWNAQYFVFQPSTWTKFDILLTSYPTPQYAGYPMVAMWQFHAGILPMVPHDLDYNRIDDPAMYRYLFQGGPKPPVVIPPEPVTETYQVIVANLTVRAGPGTQWAAVYYLHQGDTKTVVERSGNWGRFATGRWMNVGNAYCRRIA